MTQNGDEAQANRDQDPAEEGIGDEQLPDDVRPDDDNPLARGPVDEEEESGGPASPDLPDVGDPGAAG